MGTGSFGGGGGGSSGIGGSSSGIGGYYFKDGKPIFVSIDSATAKKEIRLLLCKIPKDYLEKLFTSPLVRSFYEELFSFSQCTYLKEPCKALATEFKIKEGLNFLIRWVGSIMDKYQKLELNAKFRDIAQICIADILMKALGDDLELYFSGTCAQVLAKIDRRIFKSTSGYFLGNMIWRMLERESERQQLNVRIQIQKESQILADRIIHSFEERFIKSREAHYRDFFCVIKQNFRWFIQELRK